MHKLGISRFLLVLSLLLSSIEEKLVLKPSSIIKQKSILEVILEPLYNNDEKHVSYQCTL